MGGKIANTCFILINQLAGMFSYESFNNNTFLSVMPSTFPQCQVTIPEILDSAGFWYSYF